MKLYDCFMFFDEDLVLDIRLNTLNEFVDYFVIVESIFTHKGEKRDLNFNDKKFEKFRDKIIYLVYDKQPNDLSNIKDQKNDHGGYIINALLRENGQRNFISEGIKNASDNDIILISDVDEIPNLENLNFNFIKEKILLFKQDMFYYKFDLKIPNLMWTGTKGCRKKNLISPQWLRNVKDRKYPLYRLDTFFSKKKYIDIKIFEKGGWHFSNIKTPEEIEHKLKSYLHHREFDLEPLSVQGIKKIMESKQAIYDLRVDQTVNKIGIGSKLTKFEFNKLPNYIKKNKKNFEKWLD